MSHRGTRGMQKVFIRNPTRLFLPLLVLVNLEPVGAEFCLVKRFGRTLGLRSSSDTLSLLTVPVGVAEFIFSRYPNLNERPGLRAPTEVAEDPSAPVRSQPGAPSTRYREVAESVLRSSTGLRWQVSGPSRPRQRTSRPLLLLLAVELNCVRCSGARGSRPKSHHQSPCRTTRARVAVFSAKR